MKTMKEEFPKMPESIREMMQEEVEKQVHMGADKKVSRGFLKKRTALAVLAAAVAVSGTALAAASGGFQLLGESNGLYGLLVGLTSDEKSEEVWSIPDTISARTVRFNSIPDGMEYMSETETWMLRYTGESEYAINTALYVMDENAAAEKLENRNVSSSENLTINDHSAVYLEYLDGKYSRFYIFYPEYYYVMEVFLNGIGREEASGILENVTLEETGEELKVSEVYATWSQLISINDGVESTDETELEDNPLYTVSAEELEQTLEIGESLTQDGLSIAVTDMQTADDLSLLSDTSAVDEQLTSQIGEDGKLIANTIEYLKEGDGVDSLDTAVRSETATQKLVYLTIEYANTTDTALEDVLFFFNYFNVVKTGEEQYTLVDRDTREAHGVSTEWYRVSQSSSAADTHDMIWWDVSSSDQNGSNYIPEIASGETVTLHIAFLVNEDQLDGMYLSIGGCGEAPYFGNGGITLSETVKLG